MADNIKFKRKHMTFIDGYFYMFDEDTDMLLQKTDDGVTAFSYPFDTLRDDPMISLEYDGINFWTMHVSGDGQLDIHRWRIDNYVCKLQNTIYLTHPDHYFDSEACTVEHYHCTTSGSYNADDTIVYINSDDGELPGDLLSGMTAVIGPNSAGEMETHYIQYVNNNQVTFADPLENSYPDGTQFLFYNYIWLFNDADGENTDNGALYKINAYSGSIIKKYPGGVYKDIKACTFAEIDHFIDYSTVNSLMYVKASNLLFININDPNMSYYGSMAMDTIHSNEIEVLDVFDLAVWDRNLYRLQQKATYYGDTEGYHPNYNYQAATFNQMVTSVALTANPNVIAANGISTADLVARIKDQFLQPIPGKIVYFEVANPTTAQSDPGTIVTGYEHDNTDSDGKALSIYRSGTEAELIIIEVKVEQS